MSFSVETIDSFEKSFKRLSRKYLSLKNDLSQLIDSLLNDPLQGTSLGNDFYKIRLSISSKEKGKSGGARVITLVKVINKQVILCAVYDKSEQVTISDKELKTLAEKISRKWQ